MRIGCCLPGVLFKSQGGAGVNNDAEALEAAYRAAMEFGYDYVEVGVGILMGLTDEEMEQLVARKEAGMFMLEVCNGFIPADFQVANAAQLPALTEYVEKAMSRMSRLGVEYVVFGSGRSRKLMGEDVAAEIKAVENFLRMCAEMGAKYDVTVVIEPLHKGETNIFNSVSEGASMARKLNLDRVKLLADAYHTFKENEYLSALEANADILCHVHVAEPPERKYPGKVDGEYLRDFAKHLHGAKYDGRVSIECNYDDFLEDIQKAYPLMRELFS